jgi:D-alanyl-D-alanine dipeptidase
MSGFFGDLEDLRQRPLPDPAAAHERRKGYRDHPIDKTGPLYAEALTDIRALGIAGRNYYHRPDNPPYYVRVPGSIEALLLRRSVAARLQTADQTLRRHGLSLHVHDAYRPLAVQRYFHDEWMHARVRGSHPGLGAAEIAAEVEKYWAAPTTSESSPAPHSTGGAVDVTIRLVEGGEPLYMGSIFDDVTRLAHTDHFERPNAGESYSDAEARANRRLLYWAMLACGFANNPNEWWHFSWGDQMWARLTGVVAAHFGPAEDAPSPSPA